MSGPPLAHARACLWSDDGAHLAVATGHGVVLWRLGGEPSLRPIGEAVDVDVLAFEGAMLWSAGAGELRCHDASTGAMVRRIAVTGTVVALSAVARVWVARRGAAVEIGDIDGRREVLRFHRPDVRARWHDEDDWEEWNEEDYAVRCAAVAPDGRRLVIGYTDGACWMLALPDPLHPAPSELQAPNERMVTVVAWSPQSDVVLVAGGGRFALHGGRDWRPRPHDARATVLSEQVTAAAFSPRGDEFAITCEYGAEDGGVEDLEFIRVDAIDERADRKYVQIRDIRVRRHIASACAAAHDPSGRVLALCNYVGGVSLWDVEQRDYLGTLQVYTDRTAGLLAHEPRTVGEPGRIELVGDPQRLAALGGDVYGVWTEGCTVSSGRGALADALGRRLTGSRTRR